MSVDAVCLSHSPLLVTGSTAGADAAVDDALAAAAAFVREIDPHLVVCLAPDHLNGFLCRSMPQVCVGTAATAIGDFGSPAGALRVPEGLSLECAEALLAAGVDVAVSRQMEVDHGFGQPLHLLTGALDALPVVPIFINAAAPPLATMARVRAWGEHLGRWAAHTGRRVLFVGSGGLSHDPPTPVWNPDDRAVQTRMLDGIRADARAAREASVRELADSFVAGRTELLPLEPAFDRDFLDIVSSGRLDAVDSWEDEWMTQRAGRAVHEVRTWVAACSALDVAAAGYDVDLAFYRPMPEWLVGFGVLTARGRT